jgi:gluconate 2-dehydrogenase gamma chain
MTSHPPTAEPVIALTFFNDFEARTVEAIAERMIPGEDGDAGATDAGVVYYIDRAVSGFSTGLQRLYRVGLRDLDAYCQSRHGASFVALATDSQDDVVRRFLGPEIPTSEALKPAGEDDYDFVGGAERAKPGEIPAVLERFFAVVREHAIEGLFCDPIYGGNRDAVGWRLVGFPGVHWGYTVEQMKEGFDGRRLPIRTLSDLRRGLAEVPDNMVFTQSDRA